MSICGEVEVTKAGLSICGEVEVTKGRFMSVCGEVDNKSVVKLITAVCYR